MKILYFDYADQIYARNIDLLENPLLPICITADLTTNKTTNTSFITITEHIIDCCVVCTLKEIDYSKKAMFENDENFDESLRVIDGLQEYIVIPHDGDILAIGIKNLLLTNGIDIETFDVKDRIDDLLINIMNYKEYQSNSLENYFQNNVNKNKNDININIKINNNDNNNIVEESDAKDSDINESSDDSYDSDASVVKELEMNELQGKARKPINYTKNLKQKGIQRLLPLPLTSDCGSNIVKAAKIEKKLFNIKCKPHNGNRSMEYGTEMVKKDCPKVKIVIVSVKDAIAFNKRSELASKLDRKLKNSIHTRFTSLHETLHSYDKNCDQMKRNNGAIRDKKMRHKQQKLQ